MEDDPQNKVINFLPKPEINKKHLKYIINSGKVYANLYEIFLTKTIKLYQYPFKIDSEIESGDFLFHRMVFKSAYKELKSIYGECLISGDSLYGTKKIEEIKNVQCIVYSKGRREFTLKIEKCATERTINQDDVKKDTLIKQFLELIIKDILHSNPKLEFYKDVFVLTTDVKNIEQDNVSINFYPGFTTSFMETDKGNFLNVTLKNKIIQNESILDYLNYNYEGYEKDKDIQKEIKEDLKGRSFKVSYKKGNFKIDDIDFDHSPSNQTINYEGKSRNLVEYYKMHHKKDIKNKQPLIVVKAKDAQGSIKTNHYIPELCSLAGLEDSDTKNGEFMKELAYYTKLEPNEKVKKINEFIKLLDDDSTDDKHPISSKKKKEYYGIEIKPASNLFDAYYMEETKLLGGKNKTVKANDRTFPVLDKVPMTNWVCFYDERNYNDADKLSKTLIKASEAYGLKISQPNWQEMPKNSKLKDWISSAEQYFPQDQESEYDFAVFLIGKNDDELYRRLKIHSLCKNGYVSQVIKVRSINNPKRAMSVC